MSEQNEYVVYEFGSFRVDTLRRQLFRDGTPVQLTSKAFDTFAMLLAHHGATVLKADLMDTIWPETAVEENNLTQQISALRKALGERAGEHKFIVTVPGRGYCFVASVQQLNAEAESQQTASRRDAWPGFLNPGIVFGYGLGIVYILAVCIPSFFLDWQAETRGVRPQSIAILQFRSAGLGDELLGMGIRDTLRAKLGNIEDITVRPYNADVPEDDVVDAGRRMHVDVVLTGSIQRDEDRVRVAVEMVDVSSERILWGNTFDDSYSNAFKLQDSIATAVLSVLERPRVTGALHGFSAPVAKRRPVGFISDLC